MGTEVLYPQDCMIRRIGLAPAVFNRGRRNFYGNGNPTPSNNTNHRKPRKRSPEPAISKKSASSDDLRQKSNEHANTTTNHKSQNLALGQVTILKRGESIDVKIKSEAVPSKRNGDEFIVCGTERLGPDPGMVPKQIKLSPVSSGLAPDMYAGSAFSVSPSPSALPLPSFFSKKQDSKSTDDSATRDLRRLLRLD